MFLLVLVRWQLCVYVGFYYVIVLYAYDPWALLAPICYTLPIIVELINIHIIT